MKVSFGQGGRELTGPVCDGICIRQSFQAAATRLTSVSIYLATYKRKNPGEVVLELLDFRGKVIAAAKVNAEILEDNSLREFGLGADMEMGKMYELRLFTKGCRSGMSPTAAWGKKKGPGHLFVGARLIRDGELACVFDYVGEKQEPPQMPEKARKAVGPAVVPAEAAKAATDDSGEVPGLISVVIPHYNCQEYLPGCLAALAAQTYSCFEVFVVDDGSEYWQDTEGIVAAWKSGLNALTFRRRAKNGGAPAARNEGAAMAAGEYLMFLDADVRLYPRTFELLVGCLLDDAGADFAYGGFIWGNARVEPKPFDVDRLKRGNFITTMSMMRRRVFPGWDESLKRHQDWDLWLTVVENGGRGVCCGKYIFETPQREDGISSGKEISMKDSQDIVRAKHRIEVQHG